MEEMVLQPTGTSEWYSNGPGMVLQQGIPSTGMVPESNSGGSRIRVFDNKDRQNQERRENKAKNREQTKTKTKDIQEGTENHWERNGG